MCCILPSLLWYRRMKTVTAIVLHQTRGAFNLWVCCLSQKKTFNYQFIDKKEKHWSRKDSFLMFLRSNTVIFLSYPNWFLLQDLSITLSNFTATYPFDKQKLLPFISSKKKKKFECSTYALSTAFQSCHLLIYYYWLLLLQCI